VTVVILSRYTGFIGRLRGVLKTTDMRTDKKGNGRKNILRVATLPQTRRCMAQETMKRSIQINVHTRCHRNTLYTVTTYANCTIFHSGQSWLLSQSSTEKKPCV